MIAYHLILAVAVESSADSNVNFAKLAVTFAVGVLTALAGHYLVEAHQIAQRVARLRRSMACNCFMMIHSMKQVRKQIAEYDAIDPKADWSKKASALYSGFVVAGPLDEMKELIPYVEPDEASLITYFLVRWNRFSSVEARYNSAHQKLVDSAARVTAAASDSSVHQLLVVNYWEDIENELKSLRKSAEDMIYVGCKLIRRCQANDDRLGDITSLSLSNWKTWESFAADETECEGIWEQNHP